MATQWLKTRPKGGGGSKIASCIPIEREPAGGVA
jgi:hypothetical protein